jgi:hypothetical protein
MRHSAYCVGCGYETPLVEDEEDIDWDLLDIHQEWCEALIEHKKNLIESCNNLQVWIIESEMEGHLDKEDSFYPAWKGLQEVKERLKEDEQ